MTIALIANALILGYALGLIRADEIRLPATIHGRQK